MITYRDAKLSDAVALDRIFTTSFCDTFAHLYRREDLDAFLSSFGIADWEEQLGDPAYAFRAAEADGELVGYVKLPVEPTGPAILLDQLYILKEYHGLGMAHALMDWAFAEASSRKAEEMYLTVYVNNHRARRFYQRYGFEAVGPYQFMVGDQADEDVIMRLAL